MNLAILLLSLTLLLGGLIVRLLTWNHRTDFARSIRWYNIKYWFMPWKAPDMLTEKGLRLHITSINLIFVGIALYLFSAGVWPLL